MGAGPGPADEGGRTRGGERGREEKEVVEEEQREKGEENMSILGISLSDHSQTCTGNNTVMLKIAL